MKKALLFTLLLCPSLGLAQGQKYKDVVLSSGGFPFPTVRVCTEPAVGTPCTPLASIFSDPGLTVPLSNPFSGDAGGNFAFYASTASTYHAQISGSGIASYDIPNITLPGGGVGGSGSVTQINTGAGLTGGPITTTGTISIPNAGVTNVMLANSSITINLTGGLTGGGTVALGSTVTIGAGSAAGTVNNCNTINAIGIYTATGTVVGCDALLTENGSHVLYGANGTSLLPAYSFTTAPDIGVYSKVSANTFAISTATRTSNVSTLNMVSLPTGADVFYVGGGIHVAGVTSDTTFNGDFTVAGVTGSTVTFAQVAANSSAGTGGTAAAWTVGLGGYQAMVNRIVSNSAPTAPIGFMRLGATDQINFYCPTGSVVNSGTGCNLISGNGSSGPVLVGDGLGVQFNGPGLFPGTVFDFTPGDAMTPCAINTHSCWGVSNDGNFYIAPNGGSPVRVGTVLPAAVLTSITFSALADSNTPPTVSGFGTTPSVVHANGTAGFEINVGGGGAATTGTITFPTATNHWAVHCDDVTTVSTTVFITKPTGPGTATTAVIGNFNTAGAAAAWVANDILQCIARAE